MINIKSIISDLNLCSNFKSFLVFFYICQVEESHHIEQKIKGGTSEKNWLLRLFTQKQLVAKKLKKTLFLISLIPNRS